MEYLNTPISVLILTQKDIGNMEERFASASDCLESWDDSYIIAVVNAQKDLRHPAIGWHNYLASQYQGSEINY